MQLTYDVGEFEYHKLLVGSLKIPYDAEVVWGTYNQHQKNLNVEKRLRKLLKFLN